MNLRKKGFTLIELLVVIAIIGILAAIILPVFAQARRNAFRNADMSNMNQLRTALQLYKTDQGAAPPALLGYVTLYASGPNAGNVIPADQIAGTLYPKLVTSVAIFDPSLDRGIQSGALNLQTVNPVWPNGLVSNEPPGACLGNAPDAGCVNQRFGPSVSVSHCEVGNPNLVASNYYRVSGYDVARITIAGGGFRDELHYAPFWSGFTVPAECNPSDTPGSGSDDPRQLGYTDPPETTVVTWDTYFRDYDASGNPVHGKQDIVLFLGGDARPFDPVAIATSAWKVTP